MPSRGAHAHAKRSKPKARGSTAAYLYPSRRQVITILHAAGGVIQDTGGRATSMLFSRADFPHQTSASRSALLRDMERDGVITRVLHVNGKRTYRIELCYDHPHVVRTLSEGGLNTEPEPEQPSACTHEGMDGLSVCLQCGAVLEENMPDPIAKALALVPTHDEDDETVIGGPWANHPTALATGLHTPFQPVPAIEGYSFARGLIDGLLETFSARPWAALDLRAEPSAPEAPNGEATLKSAQAAADGATVTHLQAELRKALRAADVQKERADRIQRTSEERALRITELTAENRLLNQNLARLMREVDSKSAVPIVELMSEQSRRELDKLMRELPQLRTQHVT